MLRGPSFQVEYQLDHIKVRSRSLLVSQAPCILICLCRDETGLEESERTAGDCDRRIGGRDLRHPLQRVADGHRAVPCRADTGHDRCRRCFSGRFPLADDSGRIYRRKLHLLRRPDGQVDHHSDRVSSSRKGHADCG